MATLWTTAAAAASTTPMLMVLSTDEPLHLSLSGSQAAGLDGFISLRSAFRFFLSSCLEFQTLQKNEMAAVHTLLMMAAEQPKPVQC